MPCLCGKKKASNGNECDATDDPTFEDYLRFANALVVTLRRPEDREYFEEIIRNCERINKAGIPEANKHIEVFLSYFLKVLHKTCSTQPLDVYDQWYVDGPIQKSKRIQIWLEENKSFLLMEKTDDGGMIFYTAIATDPDAGWDKGGLAKL